MIEVSHLTYVRVAVEGGVFPTIHLIYLYLKPPDNIRMSRHIISY